MTPRPDHRLVRPRLRAVGGSLVALMLAVLVLPAAHGAPGYPSGAPQEGFNWIHYQIDGDATEEHEEKDVVMCSKVGDGDEFELRSLGEWIIGAATPNVSFGEHEARFELSSPLGTYRDDDGRTDDRAWGDGTLVLEDGGKDSMGFAVFKGTFEITSLEAESGFSFTLRGSFACQVL